MPGAGWRGRRLGLNESLAASVRGMDPEVKRKLLEELRGGPKPRTPEEAAREAAARASSRQEGGSAGSYPGTGDLSEFLRMR